MKKIHSQESGRSMVEMLGVLAIIGVLSVGGIAGYSQAMNKFKVTKTTDQIQTLVTNIRTLTSSQRNMDLVNQYALLQQMGALPNEMCSGTTCSAGNMVNPYGGQVLMGTYDGDTKKKFYIRYNDLPTSACISLATQAWGDASSGLDAVQAAKASVTTVPTGLPSGTGVMLTNAADAENPMSMATAAAGCGSGSSTDKPSVTFYYR